MRAFNRSLFFAFVVFCLCFAAGMLVWGCSPIKPPPPPFSIFHPFRDMTQMEQHLQSILTFVNVTSFVVFLGSLGLTFVSALSWLSRIVAPIAGTIAAGTLLGIFAVPFAPLVLGVTVLGLAGYEFYVWYKNRPTPPPQKVTLVH